MLRWGFPRLLLRKGLEGYLAYTPELQTLHLHVSTFVDDFYRFAAEGKGISLRGQTGTGKTHLAVAACRALLEQTKIASARFWFVPTLLTKLRQGTDDERRGILGQASCAAVLVLDDLGAQKTTEWVVEQVTMIVDQRVSNGLPIIVTTNDRLNASAERLGARIASRLAEATYDFAIQAADFRLRRTGT